MAEEKKVEKKKKPGLLALVAAKYNMESAKFLEVIKSTVMRPGKDGRVATNEEIAAFLVVAQKYNLDPFTNEIYAFPSKRGGIIPVVGIDGFVSQINKHKDFNGMDIAFSEDETTMEGAKSCPDWCEVTMYRKNLEKPITAREYLDEVYCPPKGGYPGPWQSHTKRMLRHKAIIQAARIAFGITGIYDPDEAARIIEAEVVDEKGKPDVVTPQAKDAIEHKPVESKYKKMLNDFQTAKEVLGDKRYYEILGKFKRKHANEVKKLEDGRMILSVMSVEADKQERVPGQEG